jgi:hypothetical protein
VSLRSNLKAIFHPTATLRHLYAMRYTCAYHCRDGHGYVLSYALGDAPAKLKCPVCGGAMRPDAYQDRGMVPVLIDNDGGDNG